MFNVKLFKEQILKAEKTISEVADMLGISESTLYRKMNGTSDFYRNEIVALCEFLDIKDPCSIFFANKIA